MFYRSKLMAEHGFNAVFSDREGGCSAPPFSSLNLGSALGDNEIHVAENLDTLCHYSALAQPHQAKQVHGTGVLHCHGAGKLHTVDADILLAERGRTSLAVRTADCLPMLLADPETEMVVAVHAGWKGLVQNIVAVAVMEMAALGVITTNIIASLGPCIGPCCFAINREMAKQFQQSCREDYAFCEKDKLLIDMRKVAACQLLQSGLQQQHIECSSACTVCQTSPSYFSYRRDLGKTGRQLSMIGRG